jgi:hypothetical protein
MPKHGEVVRKGLWKGHRWCEVEQQHHGWAYPCPTYSPETLTEIEEGSERLRANLRDPAWRAEQKRNTGIDDFGLAIFDMFMGVDHVRDEEKQP